jgi:ABC-2 type transport system ATP-binding protein
MSVHVHNLTKTYGSQTAVNGISFDVKPGEILGFLGPNGAGKSTTMKILAGFIPPSSGSASVCGQNITEQSISVRKNIGYLPENNPLYHDMYVQEFLEFSAQVTGLKKNVPGRISELVETVGLTEERKKKIGQLSKGYKQRVGLAQALLHDPQVLILDEPTSGLDPNQLADIRALIKKLGKEKTILFSTHIMQEVETVCDRIIIINRGSIVADDITANLQNSMRGRAIVIAEFERPADIGAIENLAQNISVDVSGNTYRIRCSDSLPLRKKLFELAASTNNPLLTLHEESQNLEAVFHELTQSH